MHYELSINDHISDLTQPEVDALIATLPEWRREIAMRYKFLQGRAECAVGYIEFLRSIRLAFGIQGMPEFSYNEHGKPMLADHPEVHFSISHCKSAVGCLAADCPCGLDLERIRPVKSDLVNYTMSPAEADAIFSSVNPALAFTRLWTRKEAVLKLRGTGIVDDLKHVLDPENICDLKLQTIENPYLGYVLTTALQH